MTHPPPPPAGSPIRPPRTLAVVLLSVVATLGLVTALGAGVAQPTAPAQPSTPPPTTKITGFSPQAVDSCVVQVHVRRHTGPTSAVAHTGTGVVLPGGRVLTAMHLFKDEWTDVEIIFGGRNAHGEQAVLWKGEPTHFDKRDMTLLEGVRAPDWVKPAKIAKRPAAKGDSLVSFGLSRPSRPRLRGGVVDEVDPDGTICIDVNSSDGDSGGPTFNQNNELVGIHHGVMTRSWEGKWGKKVDVLSMSYRVTDMKELAAPEKAEKKP